MDYSRMTSWHLVGLAGTDTDLARREFALRYEKFVRRVLAKRWLGTVFRHDFDDAVQEVFFECFKPGGVIEKADVNRGGSFRSLLYQVAFHVAARFERTRRQQHLREGADDWLGELPSQDLSGFEAVTREEVTDLVREALRRMLQHHDPDIRSRGQLLERRTCQNERINVIADGDPELAKRLHREHSKAKMEWKQYLVDVVQSEYRVPEHEAHAIVADLLSAFA